MNKVEICDGRTEDHQLGVGDLVLCQDSYYLAFMIDREFRLINVTTGLVRRVTQNTVYTICQSGTCITITVE